MSAYQDRPGFMDRSGAICLANGLRYQSGTTSVHRDAVSAAVTHGWEPQGPIVGHDGEPYVIVTRKLGDALGFVERAGGGPGRTSIKRSHRAEGNNFVD